jgi:hypothetical protein
MGWTFVCHLNIKKKKRVYSSGWEPSPQGGKPRWIAIIAVEVLLLVHDFVHLHDLM